MWLLVLIYVAFISLGLPDGLLGSSWPVMHLEINAPLESAGIISFSIAMGTIVSSAISARLTKRFGTGKIIVVSVAMTAIALIGYSFSSSMLELILWSIPLGLGAGAIDAALNNYVALHYSAKHMNWLHSFWGLGATGGPLILSFVLMFNGTWRNGYTLVGSLQVLLVIILMFSVKYFINENDNDDIEKDEIIVSNYQALKIKGVKYVAFLFLLYCSLEASTGIWAASFLTTTKGVSTSDAALWTSLYYFGITGGRFIAGLISNRIKSTTLISVGMIIILIGAFFLLIGTSKYVSLTGMILIGLGCAPIFPNLIHLIPKRFGSNVSQVVIGLSMVFAYIGILLAPPFVGFISKYVGLGIMPIFIVSIIIIMIGTNQVLMKRIPIKE